MMQIRFGDSDSATHPCLPKRRRDKRKPAEQKRIIAHHAGGIGNASTSNTGPASSAGVFESSWIGRIF